MNHPLRKHFDSLAITFVLCFLLIVATLRADEPNPIAAEAASLLGEVRQTQYQHRIHINESVGVFETDCSGWVQYVLQQAAADRLAEIEKPPQRKRPLAEDFYKTFSTSPTDPPTKGWQQITHVAEIRPGDILAWKSLTHEDGDKTDTGHVMVIDSSAAPQADDPKVFAVTVIDSTMSPHANDTRRDGRTGVGRGTIFLMADEQGRAIGYHWRNPHGPAGTNPIAIGRVCCGS